MSLPPEPRANPALHGHDAAAAAFAAAARAGTLAHAWLISGPEGLGKATFAFRAARWLLDGLPEDMAGEPPLHVSPDRPLFRRVAAGAEPDLVTLEPNTGEKGRKEVLRVDDARRAIRFLSHTAAGGGWRVVVLDSLERADNVQVQNILLKTLEEPPPRTVLLLTTAQPARLLPTIRSRCRRLELQPLPADEMDRVLSVWLPDLSAAERGTLAGLGAGSPGAALRLGEEEAVSLAALSRGALAAGGATLPKVLAIADRVTARRDPSALTLFFALLRRDMAAGLREAARGGAAKPAWLGARSLADGAHVWETLGRLAADTDQLNLERKQAVITALGWVRGRPAVWD